ncbi:MAG: TAT-variant-translocated molybdopterin oxidoreductase [Polyangiaceae bacterium]|nr:TAT-variant-translocated molybdopterin oxidoreductase [Polyangiaceae bacterium]
MKRLPIADQIKNNGHTPAEPSDGTVWFQTFSELHDDPKVAEARVREFTQERPYEPPDGVDRRTFMTLMGASMALAGLAGCRRAEEHIVPFSKMPEGFVPGRSEYYATAMPLYGTAVGLLVESVDGRPIKIEGNPDHPETLGGTTSFIQASVLNLYDPDRSKAPRKGGQEISVEDAWKALADIGRDIRGKAGRGVAILSEDHRSPTTALLIKKLYETLPQTEIYRFEAFGRENQRTGYNMAFGEPRDVSYDLSKADVIVALDADILGNESNPVKNSKGFAARRNVEKGNMSRIYVAEPCPTVTGHGSDHRLRIQSRRIGDLLKALASALVAAGAPIAEGIAGAAPTLSETEKKWVEAAAKDLAKAKQNGVIALGNRQPAALHALAAALNHGLGAVGNTITTSLLPDLVIANDRSEGVGAFSQLIENLKSGKIDTLIILGGNPVFNAPVDRGFADALKKAKTSVHLSSHYDETSELCTLHVPRAHFLESWSDVRTDGGLHSVVQPLIAPMYNGRTDAEVIEHLLGGVRTPYELVLGTWGKILGSDGLENAFSKVIHDGVHLLPADQVEPETTLELKASGVTDGLREVAPVAGEFEVVFAPDPHAYDGRFANNGWLMELPDPVHKATWGTVAAVSHTTAKKLGVESGDIVEVTVGDRKVSVPVSIAYGHADDSITLPVGLGRKFPGRVCTGVGVDVNQVRTHNGWYIAGGTVKKTGQHEKLAITQGHFVMEGRPLIRTQTVEQNKADPTWGRDYVSEKDGGWARHPPLINLWTEWEYKGHKWGMAVDLTLCTGCMACVTACQSENNIPVVGAAGVLKSREMHWIRIDRYFAGKDGQVEGLDDAQAATMPLPCQHCENAPCEQVCPVNATSHSPEGINEMTYNRCIGTKYCGNNCPYKVRRFNYFNWNKDIPEEQKLGLNPDVTVRFRGVMEKCTFCVQRVNQGKIAAKKQKDAVAARQTIRGIQSACMQACPTNAITFGDLNDPGAHLEVEQNPDARKPVGELAKLGRAYGILTEINTRPRISYLARVTNPSPDLPPPTPVGLQPAAEQQHHDEKREH